MILQLGPNWNLLPKGVFLAEMKNAIVNSRETRMAWTQIHEFQPFHEGVSKVSERAREESERLKQV